VALETMQAGIGYKEKTVTGYMNAGFAKKCLKLQNAYLKKLSRNYV
jgi:hypothetical protein